MTEADVAEILRHHGSPVAVAARYGHAIPLVGAELAPYFWFTLRRVAPIMATIAILARVVTLVYAPHTVLRLGHEVLGMFGAVLESLLNLWMILTLLFVVLDGWRRRSPQTFIEKWDPRHLPKLRHGQKDGRPKYPLVDLAFTALFLVWLLAFPRFPLLFFGPLALGLHALSLDLAPVWHEFYWLVVGFNCIQLLFRVIALSDVSMALRRGMKLTENLLPLGMLVFLLRAPEYVIPDHRAGTHPLLNLSLWNGSVHQALTLVVTIVALRLAWDIVGLLSHREGSTSTHATAH